MQRGDTIFTTERKEPTPQGKLAGRVSETLRLRQKSLVPSASEEVSGGETLGREAAHDAAAGQDHDQQRAQERIDDLDQQ